MDNDNNRINSVDVLADSHKAVNTEINFRQYCDKMVEVFGYNAKVGICFALAALFGDVVWYRLHRFPLLYLFGPKASGKTEFAKSLTAFFGHNSRQLGISSISDGEILDLDLINYRLVYIDGYKNNISSYQKEFLKSLYNGVRPARLTMNPSNVAPFASVILSGNEKPLDEIALYSRMVCLPFENNKYSVCECHHFNELVRMRDPGVSNMANQLLSYRKLVDSEFLTNYYAAIADIKAAIGGQSVADRIFHNWAIPLAIFACLSGVVDFGFYYYELQNICASGVERQYSKFKSNGTMSK